MAEGSGLGWVTAEYAMLPRATNTSEDRESSRAASAADPRDLPAGRPVLRAAVDYKALGENTIVIDCDVLQADGAPGRPRHRGVRGARGRDRLAPRAGKR